MLKADGLNEAIIGRVYFTGQYVYSVEKCIEIVAREMPIDQAIEYLEFNTFQAYVGENTPIFIETNIKE